LCGIEALPPTHIDVNMLALKFDGFPPMQTPNKINAVPTYS